MNNPDLTNMKILFQLARLLAAVILLQTLYFKFTGQEESVYIFSQIESEFPQTDAESIGRYASGVVELIAAVLLFVPGYVWLGATLSLGTMAGAIATHLTVLGIEIMDDGGLLFGLACTVFLCSLFVLWHKRSEIPLIGKLFKAE